MSVFKDTASLGVLEGSIPSTSANLNQNTMEKQKVKLIEDREYKGYFKGVIEINGMVFHTDAVMKLEQWEKKFEIIQIINQYGRPRLR